MIGEVGRFCHAQSDARDKPGLLFGPVSQFGNMRGIHGSGSDRVGTVFRIVDVETNGTAWTPSIVRGPNPSSSSGMVKASRCAKRW